MMVAYKAEWDWAHTCEVLALLFNVHRDPKRASAVSARELNPAIVREHEPVPGSDDPEIVKENRDDFRAAYLATIKQGAHNA